MSITQRLLFPVVVILLLAIAIIGFSSFTIQKQQLTDSMEEETTSTTKILADRISSNQNSLDVVVRSLKRDYIILAAAVAKIIETNNENLQVEKLQELAKEIKADEIHIIDEKGVLVHSNIPGFVGFDFNTTEQTKPFLSMGNEGLAQDPMPRGTDNSLFMYAGVKRIDQPGIVQIGNRPTAYIETLNSLNVTELSSAVDLNGKGFYLITKGEEIVSSSNGIEAKDINDLSELVNYNSTTTKGEAVYQGKSSYIVSEKAGDYTIITVADKAKYLEPLSDYVKFIAIIAGIFLVISTLVIWLVMKQQFVKPLTHLQVAISKVSKGDLSSDFKLNTKRKDSIGIVTRAFITLADSLKVIISEVSQSSHQLASSTEQVNASIEQTSDSAQTVADMAQNTSDLSHSQSELVNEISNSMNNMNNSLNNVTKDSEDALVQSEKANLEAKNGEIKVNNIVSQMEEIATHTDDAVVQISSLVNKVDEIGNITSIITQISEQTNLLALNAAIEAARAGEAGKGFAVVADEVRNLAEQSQESVKTIMSIIEQIQIQTKQTLTSINNGKSSVDTGITSSGEIKYAFSAIENSVSEVTNKIETVAKSVLGINSSSGDVLKRVETIRETTIKNTQASEESASASEQQLATMQELSSSTQNLQYLSGSLKESISKFKI